MPGMDSSGPIACHSRHNQIQARTAIRATQLPTTQRSRSNRRETVELDTLFFRVRHRLCPAPMRVLKRQGAIGGKGGRLPSRDPVHNLRSPVSNASAQGAHDVAQIHWPPVIALAKGGDGGMPVSENRLFSCASEQTVLYLFRVEGTAQCPSSKPWPTAAYAGATDFVAMRPLPRGHCEGREGNPFSREAAGAGMVSVSLAMTCLEACALVAGRRRDWGVLF